METQSQSNQCHRPLMTPCDDKNEMLGGADAYTCSPVTSASRRLMHDQLPSSSSLVSLDDITIEKDHSMCTDLCRPIQSCMSFFANVTRQLFVGSPRAPNYNHYTRASSQNETRNGYSEARRLHTFNGVIAPVALGQLSQMFLRSGE